MSVLSDVRDTLISDLESVIDVPIYSFWPSAIDPPCLFLGFESNYIDAGVTFANDFVVKLNVVIVVPRSETYLAELEALLIKVLGNTADWGLNGVDTPASDVHKGMELLTTVVHLQKSIKI